MESVIKTGDSLVEMAKLPTGCARLVFGDPPFGIGYKYDIYNDSPDRKAYLKWAWEWLSGASRLVSADGSLWVAIGDEYAAEYKRNLDALGFTMRNWIIWHYGFGVHTDGKFSRCHAHIFYYVRDPDHYIWNQESVKVPSARFEYGDKRAVPSGKTPEDVWQFPRVCGTFGERVKKVDGATSHPCQMNQAILERIIRCASNPGDLVLDPFCGSGTTSAAAQRLGRKYWSCDLSPQYVAVARERLAAPGIFGDDDTDELDNMAENLGLT